MGPFGFRVLLTIKTFQTSGRNSFGIPDQLNLRSFSTSITPAPWIHSAKRSEMDLLRVLGVTGTSVADRGGEVGRRNSGVLLTLVTWRLLNPGLTESSIKFRRNLILYGKEFVKKWTANINDKLPEGRAFACGNSPEAAIGHLFMCEGPSSSWAETFYFDSSEK